MKTQLTQVFFRYNVITLAILAMFAMPWTFAGCLTVMSGPVWAQTSYASKAVVGDLTPLQIVTGRDVLKFQVELAETASQRATGLMYRKTISPDRGMLFIFDRTEQVGMWMKNTFVSLDMLFLDDDGKIVNIARRTEPHSLDVIYSKGKVRAVLELAGGTATRLGIRPGDKVGHAALEVLR